MLTGESLPVEKGPGSPLVGASINKNGALSFRATKVGADTVLAQIVKLVEEAQGSKAPIARLADLVSGYFVPAVFGIAVLAAAAWLLAGQGIVFALTVFVAVLTICLPLRPGPRDADGHHGGHGQGRGSRRPVQVRRGLEIAHRVDIVVFDKTGTITKGEPALTDLECAQGFDRLTLLSLAASAEKGSEHPLGEAVVKAAAAEGAPIERPSSFAAVPGRGIEAEVGGRALLLGNAAFLAERGVDASSGLARADTLAAAGKTTLFAAVDGRYAGLLAVADVVKESSARAVAALRDMGIETAMITGDSRLAAAAIAAEVGIDSVLAEVLPGGKAAEIKKLQAAGMKWRWSATASTTLQPSRRPTSA